MRSSIVAIVLRITIKVPLSLPAVIGAEISWESWIEPSSKRSLFVVRITRKASFARATLVRGYCKSTTFRARHS